MIYLCIVFGLYSIGVFFYLNHLKQENIKRKEEIHYNNLRIKRAIESFREDLITIDREISIIYKNINPCE